MSETHPRPGQKSVCQTRPRNGCDGNSLVFWVFCLFIWLAFAFSFLFLFVVVCFFLNSLDKAPVSNHGFLPQGQDGA